MMAGLPSASPERQREISTRRRDLYDVMRKLEASAARPSGAHGWRDHIASSIDALDVALRRHTEEIETEDGLFDDVSVRSPNLVSMVKDLQQEHLDMAAKCREARDLIADGGTSASEIRAAVLDLLGQLVAHRQRGAELLYDSYNLELAAGD